MFYLLLQKFPFYLSNLDTELQGIIDNTEAVIYGGNKVNVLTRCGQE